MNPTGTLLGIETSGRRTALALVRDDRPVANRTHNGMDHDEVLPGMLSDLLNDAGTDISKVTGIGVSHGPGMFTALRVGLAWAAALAISRNIPVRGVSTLEVLAAGTATAEPVLALLDARKGQFYAGIYCAGSTLLPAGLYQPEALTATIATLLPTARRLPVAGDGVKPAMPHLERFNPVPTGILLPDAVQVARIAARQLATVGPDDRATLAPAYLRRTDAELSRRRSGRP